MEKKCLPKDIIKEYASIEVMIDESVTLDIEAQNIPLDVIYEDNDIIIVNKNLAWSHTLLLEILVILYRMVCFIDTPS